MSRVVLWNGHWHMCFVIRSSHQVRVRSSAQGTALWLRIWPLYLHRLGYDPSLLPQRTCLFPTQLAKVRTVFVSLTLQKQFRAFKRGCCANDGAYGEDERLLAYESPMSPPPPVYQV